MNIDQADAGQSHYGLDSPGDSVRYVMEFQVQEDAETDGSQPLDRSRSLGSKELAAQLNSANDSFKSTRQQQTAAEAVDINCND
jgi:hypothetical protein